MALVRAPDVADLDATTPAAGGGRRHAAERELQARTAVVASARVLAMSSSKLGRVEQACAASTASGRGSAGKQASARRSALLGAGGSNKDRRAGKRAAAS